VRKTCKFVGKTTDDWFNGMDAELRCGLSREHKTKDDTVIEAKLQELKNNFPTGPPYVLTHADLNTGNIIVNNGKIIAIIDWEVAGYYPWWVERYTMVHRMVHDACCDLYHMIWPKLYPEQNQEQFWEQVGIPVRQRGSFVRLPIARRTMCGIVRRGANVNVLEG
jgi:aminoglycoside phosphotransferase (APT) family kinase protein